MHVFLFSKTCYLTCGQYWHQQKSLVVESINKMTSNRRLDPESYSPKPLVISPACEARRVKRTSETHPETSSRTGKKVSPAWVCSVCIWVICAFVNVCQLSDDNLCIYKCLCHLMTICAFVNVCYLMTFCFRCLSIKWW